MSRKWMAMSHTNSKKSAWPELEGLPAEVAKQKIQADRPDLKVVVVPYGSVVTEEYDTGRVRIFLNKAGNVKWVPKIG